MSNKLAPILAGFALALYLPGAAIASYTMTEKMAGVFAVSDVTTRYVYQDIGEDVKPACRVQKSAAQVVRGTRAHRWVCNWKAITLTDQSCIGSVLIVGSSVDSSNTYYRATLSPKRCTNN